MKRVLVVILLILSMCFVGCVENSKDNNQSKQQEQSKKEVEKPIFKVKTKHVGNEEKSLEYFRDKKIKIVEDDTYNFNVYFNGMTYTETEELIDLEFENKNENLSATVTIDGTVVNEYTVDSILYSKVLRKSKAKGEIKILRSNLDLNGLHTDSVEKWNIEKFDVTIQVFLENIGVKKYNFIICPIKENFKQIKV